MYIILKKDSFFGSAKTAEEALALLPIDDETAEAQWHGECRYRVFSEAGEVQIYLRDSDIDEEGNFIDVPKEEWKWVARPHFHR